MKRRNRSDSGFTIIEVLIVLAIAGLIMLIVFLAIPALQRMERNNRRKSAVSTALTLIEQYRADHMGKFPVAANGNPDPVKWSDFTNNYLNGTAAGGYTYTMRPLSSGEHSYIGQLEEIAFATGHWCNNRPDTDATDHDAGTDNPITGNHTSPIDIVVWTRLEGGGNVFCLDNSTGEEHRP